MTNTYKPMTTLKEVRAWCKANGLRFVEEDDRLCVYQGNGKKKDLWFSAMLSHNFLNFEPHHPEAFEQVKQALAQARAAMEAAK